MIDDLLLFRVKSKESDIKTYYLHIFEQLVSLYSYTVSELYGDNREVNLFRQHMRFTAAISMSLQRALSNDNEERLQSERKKVSYILQMVDEGCSALDILEEIKRENSPLNTLDISSVQRVMEEHGILFGKSYVRHPYSMAAMNSMLENPVMIFQRFLDIPPADELLASIVKCRLADRLEPTKEQSVLATMSLRTNFEYEPLTLRRLINVYNDEAIVLDTLLKSYTDGDIKLNREKFSEEIERSILDVLQEWSEYVLDCIFVGHANKKPIIESIVDKDSFFEDGTLKLDMKSLETLCLLGQSDQIGEMLSKKIKEAFLSNSIEKKQVIQPQKTELKQLSKWYRNCKMGYLTEISQIPAWIASILYNRLEHYDYFEYVLCSKRKLVKISERGKVENLQKLTTKLIENELYMTTYCPSLPHQFADTNGKTIKTIHDFLNYESSDTNLLTCKIMKEWASYNKIRTRDRFKRPSKKLSEGLYQAKSKVESQKQNGVNHYFPVSNRFPLPFWAIK